MFCPNCGERLDSPDQRFCSSCGSKLQFTPIPEVPQAVSEEIQVPTPANTIPVSKALPIKKASQGSYSKKTFAFAFLSLALACVGFSLEYLAFLRSIMYYFMFPRLPSAPVLLIIALIFHFVGIVFATVSRSNSNKARKHEVENALEKVGRVFGILGLIANIIPLVVINIALLFISVPISLPPIPD